MYGSGGVWLLSSYISFFYQLIGIVLEVEERFTFASAVRTTDVQRVPVMMWCWVWHPMGVGGE